MPKEGRLQSPVTYYVTDVEVWPSLPLLEQKIKGYRQTMWAVCLQCVINQCVFMYLCISTHSSLSVVFSEALCTEHARSLLSGRNNLLLGYYGEPEQCFYWLESTERKKEGKKAQTVQQTRQSHIYSYYLITINIIHCQKDFTSWE